MKSAMTAPGMKPASEQLADRRVGLHAVDHHRQRRRDDRPERRRRRRDADREFRRVAVVLHRLDLDRAEAAGVGDRRARHPGEDHAAEHVDVAEAALEPADQRQREVVDAVGDAGRVHQVAGEDEERHGEQREAVDAADHPVHDGQRRHACPRSRCRAATRCTSRSRSARRSPSARRILRAAVLFMRPPYARLRRDARATLQPCRQWRTTDLHRAERHHREAEARRRRRRSSSESR